VSIFEKWTWIKRNWIYILEEASKLDLVFVGGTALNLALFKEYRASEDIDLYDPYPTAIGTTHEAQRTSHLAENLAEKGFTIKPIHDKGFFIGPNIKIEVFNDGTPFRKIERKTFDQTQILIFDIPTYAEMKTTSLLCRTMYDARDLVDLFMIRKATDVGFSFPSRDCEVIECRFTERLHEIDATSKEDLLKFQTLQQIEGLPYEEFEQFKRWIYGWLSGFR